MMDLSIGATVSAELARNPSETPGKASKRLFGVDLENILGERIKAPDEGPDDLQQAFEHGKWGESRPSDLFLRVCTQRTASEADRDNADGGTDLS
jgi:hypothetical protein